MEVEFSFLKPKKKKKKESTNSYSILMTADEFEFLQFRNNNKLGDQIL